VENESQSVAGNVAALQALTIKALQIRRFRTTKRLDRTQGRRFESGYSIKNPLETAGFCQAQPKSAPVCAVEKCTSGLE
jgi:hypothetical protein